MRAALAITLLAVGCADSASVQCGDVVCPAGSTCGMANECIPPGCGDGQVTGNEVCDPAATAQSLTCIDEGFYVGQLACSETCQLDTSGCSAYCGDHDVNGPENCDGIAPPGFSCADFGFDVGQLGCSRSCTLALDHCDAIGWREAPGTASVDLNAVWQVGVGGYAVGNGGTIMREVDGIWTPMESPTTNDLFGLYGAFDGATTRLFAVGANLTILSFDGTSWTQQPVSLPSALTPTLRAIDGVGVNAIFAVGDGGTILRYDGTSWSSVASGTAKDLHDVWVGAADAFAVGDDYTFLHAAVGAGWSSLTTAAPGMHLYSVHGVGPPSSLEVFVGGLVYDTTYTGFYRYTSASGLMKSDVPAALPKGPQGVRLLAAWGTFGNVYLGGTNGHLLHWNNSSLTAVVSPTSRTIHNLHGVGPGRIIAATSGGKVLAFNGTDLERPFIANDVLRSAARYGQPAQQDVAVGGQKGTVYVDSTTGWTPVYIGSRGDAVINGLWIDGSPSTTAADVYAATGELTDPSEAGVWRFSIPGSTASRVASAGAAVGLYGVRDSSGLKIVAVGKIVQELSGGTWSTVAAPIPVTVPGTVVRSVFATPDGHWFAVGDHGFAMHDPGTGWVAIPTGVTEGLFGVWGTANDNVYAVGQLGRLLHWNGTTWRALYSGTGENLVSISGTIPSDIFATGSSGEILHYDGVSWSRMNGPSGDIHAVAASYSESLFASSEGVLERFLRIQLTNEERCLDAWDNDGDGAVNCDDVKCRTQPACAHGGACETFDNVDCATTQLAATTYSGATRLDDLACLDHSTPGPEASFRYIARASRKVTVTVDEATDTTDLVVYDALDNHCQLSTCTAATHASGTQTVTFDAQIDHTYYIVVDTRALYTGVPFTLSVICAAL